MKNVFLLLAFISLVGCSVSQGINITPVTPATPPTSSYQGVATNFTADSGITACGVPASIEPQDFVALNSQYTPNDYSTALPFPVSPSSKVGEYSNGLNCGRWVRVEIGNACIGASNSGAPHQPFCNGGTWQPNALTGAYLNMLVADACPGANAFCRDSPYHLDIHTSSLKHFILNGAPVDVSAGWNNPEISWDFIPAPNYQGDIHLGLAVNASPYWVAVMLTNLPNGLHSVESLVNGVWQKATMQVSVGQIYVLPSASKSPYTIRVYDANDELINDGKTYTFSFPSSCSPHCSVYTPINL